MQRLRLAKAAIAEWRGGARTGSFSSTLRHVALRAIGVTGASALRLMTRLMTRLNISSATDTPSVRRAGFDREPFDGSDSIAAKLQPATDDRPTERLDRA